MKMNMFRFVGSGSTWVPVRKKSPLAGQENLWGGGTILRTGPTDELRHGRLSIAGRWLTAMGVFLLGVYLGSVIHRVVSSRLALQEFDTMQAIGRHERGKAPVGLRVDQQIDFSLWSGKANCGVWRESTNKERLTLAVLRFKRLDLRVPVFEGTDRWTLNRGAGWIAGTARPGEKGNIGIAGHRDSFFRALRDARKGDVMELASATGTAAYTVDQVEIVGPEDVAVLQPRPVPALTLVTCYPFYFVGEAPQRFIVHGALSKRVEVENFCN